MCTILLSKESDAENKNYNPDDVITTMIKLSHFGALSV